MGTNYYLRPKKFEKLTILNKNLELALDVLKDDYLANVSSLIREAEKEHPEYKDMLKLPDELTFYIAPQYLYNDFDIHICKVSGGWIPSFEVNDNFTTYKEFKKFYLGHKDEFLLIDEYNKEIDLATLDSNLEYHKLTALDKNKRTSNFYANLYTDEDGYDWIDCSFE